jgi:hypothetical protein
VWVAAVLEVTLTAQLVPLAQAFSTVPASFTMTMK